MKKIKNIKWRRIPQELPECVKGAGGGVQKI